MHRLTALTVILFLAAGGMTVAAKSSHTDSGFQSVQPLPAGVSVHQLDNGLQVVLIENKALPMVGANVAVKVGSAYENFSTSGMSHMLEHLLFNGTTHRTQKQLYNDVDKIGGYNNANTNYFSTNYMMVTPAGKIEQGMEIQADMLFNSIMPAEKYEKEKGIVLEEIVISINRPATQLTRNLNSILYPGHALSLPTLGTYETIKTNELATVAAYYRNFYVPNNMILSVVGNFNAADMLELVKRYYGHAKPGQVKYAADNNWITGTGPLPIDVKLPPVSNRFYAGEKSHLQIVFPLSAQHSANYFALLDKAAKSVKEEVLEKLNEEFPQATESVTITPLPSPVQSYLIVDVTLADDAKLTDMGAWLQKTLAKSRFKISTEQADALATKDMLAFLLDIEKPHMFGIMNAETFATSGIDEVLAGFNQQDLSAEIRDVNATRLTNPIVIIQRPAPTTTQQATLEENATVLHQDANSGLTLTVKQNPGSKLLAMHILVKHKSALESMYGLDAAWILHDMLENHLNDYFGSPPASRYGVKIKANDYGFLPMDDIYLHRDFGYLRAEAIGIDVPDALQRLMTQIQTFEPDEAAFEDSLNALQQSKIMAGRVKNKTLFTDTYKQQIYAPRIYPTAEETPTFEQIKEFRRRYLALNNMIVSVVSSESVAEVIESINASIQSGTNSAATAFEVDDLRLNSINSPVNIELEAGGKQSYLYYGYTKSVAAQDIAPLEVLSLMLRDQAVFDIREKQGLAYRMSVGIKVHGDQAIAYLNMGTRPENIDILTPQMQTVFSPSYLPTIDQENLERLINKHLGRMSFQRLSSANQGYYAAHSLYFYNDINHDKDRLMKLAAVTMDDVKRVANKYLQPENPWQIVVR